MPAEAFKPGRQKGWPAGQGPASVSLRNDREADNPNHADGHAQVKEGEENWQSVLLQWHFRKAWAPKGAAFAVKNSGDVTVTLTY